MIFKERLSYSQNNILPLIKNNGKKEIGDIEIKNNCYKDQHIQNNNSNTNKNIINNNNLYDTKEKENDKSQENITYEKYNTFENARNTSKENIFSFSTRKTFIAKVELENVKSKKDCILLLNEYLLNNNKKCQYEISVDGQDKLIISFDDEKTAFDFVKIIYNEKINNSLYKYVVVHMKLLPNKNFLKKQRLERNKKGLSVESIMKLYTGSSYIKKEKEKPIIKGNIIFGIKSPFYSVHDKHKKYNSFKTIKTRKSLSRNNNNGDIYGFVGYDGLPLKSYDKFRINVLDTHYNPLSNYKYREDNKKKWLSPCNFKCY